MKSRYTLCITGGHLTPALAVIDEIKKRSLPWDILFIGRKNDLEGSTSVSGEYEEIQKRSLRFLPLAAGRLSRVFTFWSLVSLLKIPFGFLQAFWYVLSEQPRLILSFGGYVALPTALAGWICRIPVITHEQTMHMGFANRIISLIAQKVLVSFRESIPESGLPKYIVTGNPIRSELYHPPVSPSFSAPRNIPVLYITGGSTGSVSLNDIVIPLIEKLTSDWVVIHQTGVPSFHKAEEYKKKLAKSGSDRYIIAPYFGVTDVAWIYKHADIIIGRSGANTVYELARFGKIALLIPLPWSAGSEQTKNAGWLARFGAAEVMLQKDADAESVFRAVGSLRENSKNLHEKADTLAHTFGKNSTEMIVDILADFVSS